MYSTNIEPADVLHDEIAVQRMLDLLRADERIPEILVGDDEDEVVSREVAQLDVDLALGILAKLLDLYTPER